MISGKRELDENWAPGRRAIGRSIDKTTLIKGQLKNKRTLIKGQLNNKTTGQGAFCGLLIRTPTIRASIRPHHEFVPV